jgi:hypothetical protein
LRIFVVVYSKTILNLPSRLFLTVIGKRFHMVGPRTKNELDVVASEFLGIWNSWVRDGWSSCNLSLRYDGHGEFTILNIWHQFDRSRICLVEDREYLYCVPECVCESIYVENKSCSRVPCYRQSIFQT